MVAMKSLRLLAARGVNVTLLNGHSQLHAELEESSVEAISFGRSNLLELNGGTAAIRGLYDHKVRRAVHQWILRNDTPTTIYHLHNWHKVLTPAVFAALHPISSRLVMTAHDYFLACPNGAFFNFRTGEVCNLTPMSLSCLKTNCDRRHYAHKIWRTARQSSRALFMDAARTKALLIAPHEGMIEPLIRGGFPRSCIRVLRNPVAAWREERVTAELNREILFVGRLEQDKGIDVLAESAASAGLSLAIIGDGPLRGEIAARFPQHRLLGWRSRSEIAEISRGARLVVVPTRWRETFGLVTFEALLSGIPVLISRFPLVADEVVAGGMAESFDPKDIPAAASILRRLSEDNAQIERMSRNAFSHARDLAPDANTWCEMLVHIYSDRLKPRERPGASSKGRISAFGASDATV